MEVYKTGTRVKVYGLGDLANNTATINKIIIGRGDNNIEYEICYFDKDGCYKTVELRQGQFQLEDATDKKSCIGFKTAQEMGDELEAVSRKLIETYAWPNKAWIEDRRHQPIIKSTPTGNDSYYKDIWDNGYDNNKVEPFLPTIISNIQSTLDLLKSIQDSIELRGSLETPIEPQVHHSSMTEIPHTSNSKAPEGKPDIETKRSMRGNILVDQSEEGNPNGWYYLDANMVLVLHVPKPINNIKEERVEQKEYKCPCCVDGYLSLDKFSKEIMGCDKCNFKIEAKKWERAKEDTGDNEFIQRDIPWPVSKNEYLALKNEFNGAWGKSKFIALLNIGCLKGHLDDKIKISKELNDLVREYMHKIDPPAPKLLKVVDCKHRDDCACDTDGIHCQGISLKKEKNNPLIKVERVVNEKGDVFNIEEHSVRLKCSNCNKPLVKTPVPDGVLPQGGIVGYICNNADCPNDNEQFTLTHRWESIDDKPDDTVSDIILNVPEPKFELDVDNGKCPKCDSELIHGDLSTFCRNENCDYDETRDKSDHGA